MAEGKFVISAQNRIREGLEAAKNDLQNFGDESEKISNDVAASTQKMDGAFKGFVITAGDVVNAIQSIGREAWQAVEAFAEQNKSVAQFNAAMSLSGQITDEQAQSLRSFANEMEELTGEDDKAILSMQAFLAASGRNEAQIKKLIAVSADYSAATGRDMRSAVEQLNKTFGGFAGELGESSTAIKALTSEQLKAGGAIDALGRQYAGFAVQMSEITDVKIKNLNNAWADTRAAFGAAIAPIIIPALDAAVKFINEKLIPGIGSFFNVTVAIFQNIAQVAKITFALINEIIRITFSYDGLSAILQALGDNIIQAFASAFSVLPDMFLNIVGLMFNPITQLGLYIADTLTKAFSGKGKEIRSPGEYLAKLLETQANAVGNIAKDAKEIFLSRFNSAVSLAAEIGDIYAPTFRQYFAEVRNAIQPTLDRLDAAAQKVSNPATGSGTPTTAGLTIIPEGGGAIPGNFYNATGGLMRDEMIAANLSLWSMLAPSTERPGAAAFFNNGNGAVEASGVSSLSILDSIGSAFGDLVAGISPLISSFSSIKMLLDPISVILQGFMSVIGPLINNALQPLIGILTVIGQYLGQMLTPVLEALGAVTMKLAEVFVWLYNNILVPVGVVIMGMFNALANSVIGIANAFIQIRNGIAWMFGGNQAALIAERSFDQGAPQRIEIGNVMAAGSSAMAATASESAGYRTQSITINIYQQAAVVGQAGMTEFARIIRGEFVQLGYLGQ